MQMILSSSDSLEECARRLLIWKEAMEKGLRVNAGKTKVMKRSHGEGVEGKCRKDKGHDLWYRPEPLAEFRRIPMRCLSYRSRQQQHQQQWLQTLGA